MRRFIITGAQVAGKTALIRQLEIDGFSVVEEAATVVIADIVFRDHHRIKDPSCAIRTKKRALFQPC